MTFNILVHGLRVMKRTFTPERPRHGKLAIAWWKFETASSLPLNLKVKLFTTTLESVLVYGADIWTLTNKLRKMLDGCFTRLLRTALNIPWKSLTTNREVYGNLAPITERLKIKRLRFARHCVKSTHEAASKIVVWQPTHRKEQWTTTERLH